MLNGPQKRDAAIPGVVDWFSAEEGWGALKAPEIPGGCFVHFSMIQSVGFRQLVAGQRVHFTYDAPGQDGYPFRALDVWPD
jgi:CspA family cold shock protein